jgi:hypothetical protein
MLPMGLLLAVDLLVALVVAWKVPFQAPNPSYLCDARQLMATHRIATVFLPVGYSGVLGVSGLLAGQAGIVALSIALSLMVIAAAWVYLRTLGVSVRATLVLTGLLSVYPDLLLSYNKAQDTALTAVLLFLYVSLLLRAVKAQRFGVTDAIGADGLVCVLEVPRAQGGCADRLADIAGGELLCDRDGGDPRATVSTAKRAV